MSKEEIKQKIVEANEAYRFGNAIMSDLEFDKLVEEFQQKWPDEYDEFRDSLNEKSDDDKVKHAYVCGSLNKTKYDEPNTVTDFIKKCCPKKISISAKLDGLSGIAKYSNGKLVSFATRGDGYSGSDLMSKAPYVKGLCKTLPEPFVGDISIRGELVLKFKDYDEFCKTNDCSNPRNAVAGLMNQKEFKAEDISKVSFVAYTILGPAYTKDCQFKLLESFGFETAWNIVEDVEDNEVEKLFSYATQKFEMETDGLVISSPDYKNEDAYRPKAQVAFKTNLQSFKTRVIDVVFEGPSANGSHVPVAILEPVEIGGVIVSKATLHNLDFIEDKGLKIGAIVSVVRSGDVIPKILNVVKCDENCVDVELPEVCNCCGKKLVRDGVNFRCVNKSCKDQVISQITQFIKKLGCKHSSDATLDKLNIHSFDALVKFSPNKKYKTQVKLYEELLKNVFTKSKQELLAATNFIGLSETLINKIVDFYGFENIESGKYDGLPNGVGELTLQKFKDNILENLEIVNKFINDRRYNFSRISMDSADSNKNRKNGMSVCFTGKLFTMTRGEASKKAEAAGFEVKGGVNKGLTYLVTNDTASGSSKNRKAKELGTKVIDEQAFLKLVSNFSQDLAEL